MCKPPKTLTMGALDEIFIGEITWFWMCFFIILVRVEANI